MASSLGRTIEEEACRNKGKIHLYWRGESERILATDVQKIKLNCLNRWSHQKTKNRSCFDNENGARLCGCLFEVFQMSFSSAPQGSSLCPESQFPIQWQWIGNWLWHVSDMRVLFCRFIKKNQSFCIKRCTKNLTCYSPCRAWKRAQERGGIVWFLFTFRPCRVVS